MKKDISYYKDCNWRCFFDINYKFRGISMCLLKQLNSDNIDSIILEINNSNQYGNINCIRVKQGDIAIEPCYSDCGFNADIDYFIGQGNKFDSDGIIVKTFYDRYDCGYESIEFIRMFDYACIYVGNIGDYRIGCGWSYPVHGFDGYTVQAINHVRLDNELVSMDCLLNLLKE